MAEKRRKRPDSRREITRLALIEAAERMIAELGVDNVSARQIGAAIGSANITVVAYHFRNKDGLIDAVHQHREQQLAARRSELLDTVEAESKADDIHELLRALCLPLFELTDAEGQHVYARFLANAFHTRQGMTLASGNQPVTNRLVGMIAGLLPPDAAKSYELRWAIVMRMILESLAFIDWVHPNDGREARPWFEEALTMAAAALMTTRGQ